MEVNKAALKIFLAGLLVIILMGVFINPVQLFWLVYWVGVFWIWCIIRAGDDRWK